MPRAKLAHFFYLQKVKEGVAVGDRDQPSFFPSDELPRAHSQDSNQIFSAVSIHVINETTRIIKSPGFAPQ